MGATFNGPPPKRQRLEEPPQSGPFVKAFQGAWQRRSGLFLKLTGTKNPEPNCALIIFKTCLRELSESQW